MSLAASQLVDVCLDLTENYFDVEAELAEPLFSAIWRAETLTWRHLGGQRRAEDTELIAARSEVEGAHLHFLLRQDVPGQECLVDEEADSCSE